MEDDRQPFAARCICSPASARTSKRHDHQADDEPRASAGGGRPDAASRNHEHRAAAEAARAVGARETHSRRPSRCWRTAPSAAGGAPGDAIRGEPLARATPPRRRAGRWAGVRRAVIKQPFAQQKRQTQRGDPRPELAPRRLLARAARDGRAAASHAVCCGSIALSAGVEKVYRELLGCGPFRPRVVSSTRDMPGACVPPNTRSA